MSRPRSLKLSCLFLAPAFLIGILLAGCGEEAPKEFKAEDAPAAKGKDSMDYFRNNMNKKAGAPKK